MGYSMEIAGLGDAVGNATVSSGHASLQAALRRNAPLCNAKLATTRGGSWLSRRKVLTAAGDLVADDHEAWLEVQCAADGGNAGRTLHRLARLDYRLTECEITTLYLTHDAGGPQDNFIQLTVYQEDEFVDRRMFDPAGGHWWRDPKDVNDLRQASEEGPRFDNEGRRRYRPSAYRLARAVEIAAFMKEAVAVDAARRAVQRQRTLVVTDGGGQTRHMTVEELDPEGARYAWPGQRLLDDWTLSSAGRDGARVCDHWVFQTSDYTDPKGERLLSVVPAWTNVRRIAEIARAPRSVYELFGKLESIDSRLGVPFAWYFYMLHGNRVHAWAGRRILEGAEDGKIVLPEHDYRVLKNWYERPYGF